METGGTGRSFEVRTEDIEYLRHGDKPLLARLYRPLGADGARPAVVDVHGGAWTTMDRTQDMAIDTALAAAGIVVLALDFRMPPEASYPASIQDINLGIRWLKAHARNFGSRGERVGGFGGSSGAQQLMLNALKPRAPRFSALRLEGTSAVDARLAYVVLGWPVIDPLRRYHMAKERGNDRLVQAHNAFFGSEAAMVEANPQLIVERGEAEELPPTLLLQGTNDDNLPPDMADRFAEAYRKAGGAIDLHKFAGQPHTFISKNPEAPAAQHALRLMKTFILEHAA